MPLIPLRPHSSPIKAAAAQTSQLFNNPPPTGGLNFRDPISNMAPTDALVLENFIPRQQGVELRKGWIYHAQPPEGVTEYKSMFSYTAPNDEDSRVFAAVAEDIYDVTTSTATMSQDSTGSDEGYWWTVQFSTTSGLYLLAVSPGAGYWTYDPINLWQKQTVTNLPDNVRTVAVWKQRVWFTVEGSSDVYYLEDANAIAGTAVLLPMGSILRNGGAISALFNWTIDAGFSVDDFLVAVGTEGDIGVWEGYDPSTVDAFRLKGVWYIGPVPGKGLYFTPFGGDVMVLSQQGLIPMSRLVSGQYNEAAANTMPASKVQPTLSPLITELRNVASWDVFLVPKESIMVIKLPVKDGQYSQFVMNTITGAWCTFSNMPMACATMLSGQLYFATPDGSIAKGLYGSYDAANPFAEYGGTAIEGDVQCAFNAYNTPAQLKKFQMARPIFLASIAPSVKLQLNTQYVFSNVSGSPSFSNINTVAIWDNTSWNFCYFVGGALNNYEAWVGVVGLGYYGSLRMKVRGLPGTIFTSSHVMSELGGVM